MILAAKDRTLRRRLDDVENAAYKMVAASTADEAHEAFTELKRARRRLYVRVQELIGKQLSAYDAALIANYDGKN